MKRDRLDLLRLTDRPPAEPPAKARVDPALAFLAGARAGEPDALDQLVAYLTPPLLKAVRVLSGAANPDIEDLVQEVLLAVIDALPGFRGDCTLLHFAIRIAVRRSTAARRRSRWIQDRLEQLHLREAPLAGEPMSPRDATVAERRRELMRTLLGEIPDTQAETFVLRTGLGHSIEEISAITNAPINTVRSRLRLAKEALRSRIEAGPEWAELWEGST